MMNEKSIITNIIPVAILTIAMLAALLIGILIPENSLLIAFVFAILYFAFYFVTNANHLPFPMYFFISMCFVIGNYTTISPGLFRTALLVCIAIIVIVIGINVALSIKHRLPLMVNGSYTNFIKSKYSQFRSKQPFALRRVSFHCLILLTAGLISCLFQEYRGKWILLACGAILIGDELNVLTKRGMNFIIGAAIGCFLAGLIGYFHIPLSVRAWIYVPGMLITNYFMPKVAKKPWCYIIGSSMVALMAMTGNSLSQDFISRDIIIERFLCGICGFIIVIIFTRTADKFCPSLYYIEPTTQNNIHS